MADKPNITPELCRQLLRYEPETGKLFWKPRPREMFDSDRIFRSWNTKWAGAEAFVTIRKSGKSDYQSLTSSIFNKPHKAHRVAWAIHYGKWPEHEIDHINGDTLDNRICNLRSVSRRENMMNASLPSDNKSGRIGVCFNKKTGKWLATIKVNRRQKYLGDFALIEDAIAAREAAERELGYHENHGRAVG
jgi:hypothetical protein